MSLCKSVRLVRTREYVQRGKPSRAAFPTSTAFLFFSPRGSQEDDRGIQGPMRPQGLIRIPHPSFLVSRRIRRVSRALRRASGPARGGSHGSLCFMRRNACRDHKTSCTAKVFTGLLASVKRLEFYRFELSMSTSQFWKVWTHLHSETSLLFDFCELAGAAAHVACRRLREATCMPAKGGSSDLMKKPSSLVGPVCAPQGHRIARVALQVVSASALFPVRASWPKPAERSL